MVPHLPRRARAHAGVVADEMHGAVRVERGVPQRLHRRVVGHVGDHAHDLEAVGFELFDRRLQRRLLDVGQHHLHALAAEAFAHRSPDTTRAAGDDRDSPRERVHQSSPVGDKSS